MSVTPKEGIPYLRPVYSNEEERDLKRALRRYAHTVPEANIYFDGGGSIPRGMSQKEDFLTPTASYDGIDPE